jgi:hypothetical protein
MRRSPAERIVDALQACGGGPLNKSTLRMAAFASDRAVTGADYDAALKHLEADGVIGTRRVDHFVGTGGKGADIYWLCVQRRSPEGASLEDVMTPRMSAVDWARVLDAVQDRLEGARESAGQSSEVAFTWQRIATTLAAELDPTRAAEDLPVEDEATG